MKKAAKAKYIPKGFHTMTAAITVKDGAKAIAFYKKAFDAKEISRMTGPGGKGIMHAQIKIGDSFFFLGEEMSGHYVKSPPALKGVATTFYLYVRNVDAAFEKAVKAGAAVEMPVADMFWGDRIGRVSDPFGHIWMLATHKGDLTPKKIEKAKKAFFARMAR